MAITKFPARDFVIEVEDPDEAETYVEILGINSFSHTPATDRSDTAEFGSDGRHEHLVVGRGDSFSFEGFRREDTETGDRDPGQAIVETSSRVIGPDAELSYRITSPGGNTVTFSATAEVTLFGGGVTDVAPWSASVEVTGDVDYAGAGS